MMCTACGDTGYRPAVTGNGTSSWATLWADHAVMEPCDCVKWRWSPIAPHWPQPIVIPLSKGA